MRINRKNYETFFLLYADDELREDERKEVENFVTENEDLKGELKLLLAAVLPQENIIFTEKIFLYKHVAFNSPLQEKLLLKIDNQLSSSDMANINNLLQTDEQLSDEYATLLLTKLHAEDTIVFSHKKLLYKKQKDNIIAFRFIKWAVAAAIIGFGLFIGISFFNKNKINSSGIVSTKAAEKIKESKFKAAVIDTQIITITATVPKIAKNYLVKNTKIQKPKETNPDVKKEKENNKYVDKIFPNKGLENEALMVTKQQLRKKLILQPAVVNDYPQPIVTAKIIEKVKQVIIDENILPLENNYTETAFFTATEKSQNKILFMNEDDVKQLAVGGFFKRLKRMVVRSANIKTGNSITIAGFEVATK